jgi:WD40 repeat protein
VTWASFSPDGRRLLTARAARTVRPWELPPPAEATVAFEDAGRSSHGAISPDASRVVTRGLDQRTRLWDLAGGKAVPLANKLSGWVQYLAFSPDGRRVVVANGSSPWGPFVRARHASGPLARV